MVESFYSALASYYKLLYPNCEESVQRQAKALNKVIQNFISPDAKTILDAACGIGTQSIGLAQLGFKVTASDISTAEIEQARQNATTYGIAIEFNIADMRKVWDFYQRQFDVVIACDNSVPHLLTDDEILLAFKQFYRCTKPGGGCIISVRDYATLDYEPHQQKIYPRLVRPTAEGKAIFFDVGILMLGIMKSLPIL